MIKYIFVFLSFFIFSCFAKEQSLIVGTTSGYAPFVSVDNKGQYEGFDIDVIALIAEKLHQKLEIRDFGSMPGLMMALKQGKADLLIWAISITKERQKNMEMVYYQGEKVSEMPFLFWEEVPQGIEKIEDLANKLVSVEAGSFQEGIMRELSHTKIKYTDSITEAIMELKMRKTEAVAVDSSLIRRFSEQFPQIKVLKLPLPEEQQALGCGICIKKENKKLITEIRKVIEELRAEGKIAELERKWKVSDE